MSWRGRGKGSSDMVRRGSAFRTNTETYDPFDEAVFPVSSQTRPLTPKEETLVNYQRLLVNYLLAPGDDICLRVPLGGAPREEGKPLWKRLAEEIGEAYYPSDLMTDSRATLLGITSKSQKKKKIDTMNAKSSLAALESSEGNGEAPTSPRSNEDEEEENSSDDESIGGEDYNVGRDFEDEGARDDDYEDERGGGDGDEF